MANTSSTHVLNVTDNGTLKAKTTEAKELNSELVKSGQLAAKVSQARPPAAAAAARAAGQASQDSGTARGVGGLTGAAGRDFAKQSEGLGGLVRLYATFAANIFAATAAFGALSRAMDTTNMVRGLDQLGAQGGQSLGSLSKRVVALTDGAVSLREAMEATVKATSSGLAAADLERLAVGAKQASQALGVNMTDALSRLTRGITKLEPELLDELGIFIRVDDAAAKYAKTLGVAVSSLTDVQRRAAFAAETLAQVESKFGAIAIDANPYSKLAASLANLAQTGLELVNKVLGPLASILADNLGLLGLAIGAIGVKLLKTAVPAISAWREGMLSAAAVAEQTAAKLEDAFKEGFQVRWEEKLGLPALNKSLDEVDARIAKLARKAGPGLTGVSATKAVEAPTTLSTGDLTKQINQKKKAIEDLKLVEDAQSASAIKGLEKQVQSTTALREALLQRKALELEIFKQNDKIIVEAEKTGNRWFDTQMIAEKNLDAARRNSAKLTAVAAVAENTRIDGIRGAVKQLSVDLEKGGVTGWRAWGTMAKGSVVSVATRIGGLIGLLGGVGTAFAILGAVGAAIYSIGAKASKELDAASTSASNLTDNAKTARDTLSAVLASKTDVTSLNTLSAIANVLVDITNNAKTAIKELESFNKLKGPVDSAWEWIKGIFNADLTDNIAEGMAASISDALELADVTGTPGAKELKRELGKILGVSDTSAQSLKKALEASLDAGGAKAKAANALMDEYKGKIKGASDEAQNLNTKFKEAGTVLTDINRGFIPTDNLSKLGLKMIEISEAFDVSIKNGPEVALKELVAIVSNTDKLKLLDEKDRDRLLAAKTTIEETNATINKGLRDQVTLNERLKELVKFQQEGKEIDGSDQAAGSTAAERQKRVKDEIASVRGQINTVKSELEKAGKVTLDIVADFTSTKLDSTFIKGADYIRNSIGVAFDKAALSMSKVALIGATGQAKTDLTLDFAKREAGIQLRLIDSNILLARINEELVISAERRAIEEGLAAKTITEAAAAIRTANVNAREAALGLNVNQVLNILKGANTDAFKQNATALQKAVVDGIKLGLPASMARASNAAAKGEIKAGVASATATAEVETLANEVALRARGVELRNREIALEKERSVRLREILGIDSQTALLAANRVESSARLVSSQEELAKVTDEIKTNSEALKNADKDSAPTIQKRIKALQEVEAKLKAIQTEEKRSLEINQDLETSRLKFRIKESAISDVGKKDEKLLEVGLQKLELEEQILANKVANNELTQREEVLEGGRLAALKLELENRREILKVESEKSAKIREFDQKRSELGPDASASALQEISDQESKVLVSYNSQLGVLTDIFNTRKEIAASSLEDKLIIADQVDLMLKLGAVGESLTEVFGRVGTSIMSVATILAGMSNSQSIFDKQSKDNLAERIEAEKVLAAVSENGTEEERVEAAKKLSDVTKKGTKLQKDRTEEELKGYTKLVGAAKGLFKEKTFAYKALNAIEKGMHIYKMATAAKELALDLVKTTTEKSNAFQRAAAKGVEAVTTTLAAIPPPYGWVAAGITAAYIASLLGSGPKGPPGGFSAEEQQKVQGTGQMYKDGKVVDREGGALGDPTAKASSLQDSIELIEQHTFDNLEFSNKMLDSLKGIKSNTDNLSAILLQAGINVRSSKDLNLGVSTESGGLRAGTLDGLVNAVFGSESGIGKLANKISNALFGGKVTKELQDVGLEISGFITELSKGGEDIGRIFQNIKTTRDGGLFRKDKTTYDTEFEKLNQRASEAIGNVFAGIIDTVKAAADTLGKDSQSVSDIIAKFPVEFKASFKDLKPEELTAALNAEFSVAFNQLADEVFPELQEFRKSGEEFGNTVVRLARNIQLTELAFTSIGMSLPDQITKITKSLFGLTKVSTGDIGLVDRVAITESLVELSGGIEAFLDRVEFFKDNFLTDAEQLAPVQNSVSTALLELSTSSSYAKQAFSELGITTVNNRDEFKRLVLSMDLGSEAGRTMYSSLMKIAPAFAEVTEALTNLEKDFKNLEIDKLKALGQTEAARAATIAIETEAMNEATRAQYARNQALKDEIELINEAKKINDDYNTVIKDAKLATLITEQEKLTYTRSLERENISETNRALYDLVTELKVASITLNSTRNALLKGLDTLRAAANSAEKALESAARNGLTFLEGEVKKADQALSTLAQNGLVLLEGKVNTAKAALVDLVNSGLEALRSKVTEIKSALQDLVNQGLDTLRGKVKEAKSELVDLVNQGLDTLRNTAKETKSALEDLVNSGLEALKSKVTEAKDALEDLVNSGLSTLQSNVTATEDALKDLVSSGLETLRDKVKDTKDELISLVNSGLETLRGKAKDTKTALEELVSAGLETLRSTVKDTKSALEELVNSGLQALRDEVKNTKTALVDLVNAGLENLRSKARTVKEELQALAISGLGTLQAIAGRFNDQLNSLAAKGAETFAATASKGKDDLRAGYQAALDAQLEAQKAYNSEVESQNKALADNSRAARNAMRELARTIKEFVKDLATNELGPQTDAVKLKTLQSDFAANLALAKLGDQKALEALPDLSSQILTLAKEQSSTALDYLSIYSEVTNGLTKLTDSIDASLGITPEQEAAQSMATLTSNVTAANAALETWTSALKTVGIDINAETAASKDAATPAGIVRAILEAQQNGTDWIKALGVEVAKGLPKGEPATYQEFTEALTNIQSEITTATTDLADYIEQFFGKDKLVSMLPESAAETKAQILASITTKQNELNQATKDVDDFITSYYGQDSIVALVPPETVETAASIRAGIEKNKQTLADAVSAVDTFITEFYGSGKAVTLVPEAALEGAQGVRAQIVEKQMELEIANRDLDRYIVDYYGKDKVFTLVPPAALEGVEGIRAAITTKQEELDTATKDVKEFIDKFYGENNLITLIPDEALEGVKAIRATIDDKLEEFKTATEDVTDFLAEFYGKDKVIDLVPDEAQEGVKGIIAGINKKKEELKVAVQEVDTFIADFYGQDNIVALVPVEAVQTAEGIRASITAKRLELNEATAAVDSFISRFYGDGKIITLVPSNATQGSEDTIAAILAKQQELVTATSAVTNFIAKFYGEGKTVELVPPEAIEGIANIEDAITAKNVEIATATTAVEEFIAEFYGEGNLVDLVPEEAVEGIAAIRDAIDKKRTELNTATGKVDEFITDFYGKGKTVDLVPTEAIEGIENIKAAIITKREEIKEAVSAVETYITDIFKDYGIVLVPTSSLDSIEEIKSSMALAKTDVITATTKLNDYILRIKAELNIDLTPSEDSSTWEGLMSTLDAAKTTFKNATDNVTAWERKLTELGIAFTPYSAEDPDLDKLSAEFLAANTAFTDANSRITSWINSIKTVVETIAPTVPTPVATIIEESRSTIPTEPERNTALAIAVPATNDPEWRDAPWTAGNSQSRPRVYTPYFASGGDHMGGYRIVGEQGPELEATGPSRIYNNQQTKNIFNNDELIAEIRELRKEVAALRVQSGNTEYNTRKTNETFQQVTLGGQYMLIKAA